MQKPTPAPLPNEACQNQRIRYPEPSPFTLCCKPSPIRPTLISCFNLCTRGETANYAIRPAHKKNAKMMWQCKKRYAMLRPRKGIRSETLVKKLSSFHPLWSALNQNRNRNCNDVGREKRSKRISALWTKKKWDTSNYWKPWKRGETQLFVGGNN